MSGASHRASVITAEHPGRGTLYAVVDTRAHHVDGQVAERRFGAFLSPFRSQQEAQAALVAAGGVPVVAREDKNA
jgi:hypothetical protein